MPKDPKHRHPVQVKTAARELRRPLTAMEQKLWEEIRGRRLGGLKFRRQHPIGRFIADFFCADCALVIEVDGESHIGKENYDAVRTEWLEQHGYLVLRFTNDNIEHALVSVLEQIKRSARRVGGEAGG